MEGGGGGGLVCKLRETERSSLPPPHLASTKMADSLERQIKTERRSSRTGTSACRRKTTTKS